MFLPKKKQQSFISNTIKIKKYIFYQITVHSTMQEYVTGIGQKESWTFIYWKTRILKRKKKHRKVCKFAVDFEVNEQFNVMKTKNLKSVWSKDPFVGKKNSLKILNTVTVKVLP